MDDFIWKKWWSVTIIIVIFSIVFLIKALTFVDSHEVGYQFDRSSGRISVLNRTGWHWTWPFLQSIHTADSRPMQIRIEANNRVLNAMLVRFKKQGLTQFIDLHGRQDYDQTQLGEILKSYAYEGIGTNLNDREMLQKKYLFLEIISSTGGVNLQNQNPSQILKDTVNVRP